MSPEWQTQAEEAHSVRASFHSECPQELTCEIFDALSHAAIPSGMKGRQLKIILNFVPSKSLGKTSKEGLLQGMTREIRNIISTFWFRKY